MENLDLTTLNCIYIELIREYTAYLTLPCAKFDNDINLEWKKQKNKTKSSTGRQNEDTAFGSQKRFSAQFISVRILVQYL